ncbi:hypothetical protein HT031_002111 [Scenedesmus sp. PABB004]|nr:hypothetical protein HT031_002111 [Scenedesmus sp. PABB004]
MALRHAQGQLRAAPARGGMRCAGVAPQPLARRRAALRVVAGAATATKQFAEVTVQLGKTSFSSRRLDARVSIAAPPEVVWGALTDYDALGSFIPSLVENRCLERRPDGCLLYQVGAQDVAMGVKFSAACTLDIREWPAGMPDALCTAGNDLKALFPRPGAVGGDGADSEGGEGDGRRASSGSGASSSGGGGSGSGSDADSAPPAGVRDISFTLVEGDFQAFKGVWRLAPGGDGGGDGGGGTQLWYSLYVKPHPWLPVGLIQNRISSEVVTNLRAVRRYAERLHRRQQGGTPGAAAAAAGAESSSDSDSDELPVSAGAGEGARRPQAAAEADMALKRHLGHETAAAGAAHAQCVFEDAQPAFKRLRLSSDEDAPTGTPLPDQHADAAHARGGGGGAADGKAPLGAGAGCQYPLNALLKELHLERMARRAATEAGAAAAQQHERAPS